MNMEQINHIQIILEVLERKSDKNGFSEKEYLIYRNRRIEELLEEFNKKNNTQQIPSNAV